MASEKISALPTAGALDGTELVPIVQGGVNKKVAVSTLLAWLLRNLSATEIPYFDGTDLQSESSFFRTGPGDVQASSFQFSASLVALNVGQICDQNGVLTVASLAIFGNPATIDAAGNIVCNTVVPADGVTTSGILTNFNFIAGVCTSAS